MPILKDLVRDLKGLVVPQYLKEDESDFEALKGKNGGLNVNASIVGSLTKDITLQNAAVATGNGTNAELNGAYGLLTVQVKGITNATVTFEASNDGGTTWVAIRGINQNTGNGATTTTSDGIFRFSVGGIKLFRARISAWVSGTITVFGTAIAVSEPANQAATTTGTVAIDQATPGTTNAVQNKVRMVTSTILNAVTISASSNSAATSLGTDGTESEVWISVAIDKQPWGITVETIFGNAGANCVYPQYWNKALTYSTLAPALALALGAQWDNSGLTYPTSLSVAKDSILPIITGTDLIIYNQQAVDPATVTVKVYRIWR